MAAAEAAVAAAERAGGGRMGAACYFGLLDVAHAARDGAAAQRVAALIRSEALDRGRTVGTSGRVLDGEVGGTLDITTQGQGRS